MQEETLRKLLYVYTNMALKEKLTMPFDEFTRQVLPDDEADEILGALHSSGSTGALPASRSDDEDEEDEDEDEDDVDAGGAGDDAAVGFSIPAGFEVLAKPGELPTEVAGLFIYQNFTVDWYLGKILQYNDTARKYKHTIQFNDDNMPRRMQLDLNLYHSPATDNADDAPGGAWVLLKRTRMSDDA